MVAAEQSKIQKGRSKRFLQLGKHGGKQANHNKSNQNAGKQAAILRKQIATMLAANEACKQRTKIQVPEESKKTNK